MTREEITNRIYELNGHYGINLGEIEVGVVAVEALVNEIYDDFKSSTCENCRYLIGAGKTSSCNFDYLPPRLYEDEFGCNKFIRKQDE